MGKTQKQLQREETYEKLLLAALKEFAVQGYEKTSVEDICREAGFSKGAFYVHFERKEDIFFALIKRKISQQQATFMQACTWEEDLQNGIKNIVISILKTALEEPYWASIFLEFYAHAVRNDEVRASLSEMYRNWRNFLIEMFRQGQEAQLIKEGLQKESISTLLIAVVDGLVTQAKMDPEGVDLEQAAQCLSELLFPYVAKTG